MPCVHAAALPRNVLELAVVPAGGFEGIMDVDSDVALARLVAPAMRAHINQRWGHAPGTIFSIAFQGGLPDIQSTAVVLGSHSAAARAAPEEIMPFHDHPDGLSTILYFEVVRWAPSKAKRTKTKEDPSQSFFCCDSTPNRPLKDFNSWELVLELGRKGWRHRWAEKDCKPLDYDPLEVPPQLSWYTRRSNSPHLRPLYMLALLMGRCAVPHFAENKAYYAICGIEPPVRRRKSEKAVDPFAILDVDAELLALDDSEPIRFRFQTTLWMTTLIPRILSLILPRLRQLRSLMLHR